MGVIAFQRLLFARPSGRAFFYSGIAADVCALTSSCFNFGNYSDSGVLRRANGERLVICLLKNLYKSLLQRVNSLSKNGPCRMSPVAPLSESAFLQRINV